MCKALLDTGASANFISKDVVQWYDAASFDNSTVTSQFGLITKTMARDNAKLLSLYRNQENETKEVILLQVNLCFNQLYSSD